MARRLNYGNLLASVLLAFLGSSNLLAQVWPLQDSIAFPTPESAAADLSGRLYFSMPQGAILQFTEGRDSLRAFQPSGQESPQLFSWQMLRTQAYFPFQQSLILIDQNLNEVSQFTIPETILGNAFLSADQQLWYVNSERLLKKYNPVLDQVVLSTSLQWYIDSSSSILSLQEYQNRLYVQTIQHVLIMDLYGNYLSQRPLKTSREIKFSGNYMYYVENQYIKLIDLYNSEAQELSILITHKPEITVLTDNYLHIFSNNHWFRYQRQTTP